MNSLTGIFFDLQRIFRPLYALMEAATETQDQYAMEDGYEDVARAAVRFHGDLEEYRNMGGLPHEVDQAITEASAILAAVSIAALGVIEHGSGFAPEQCHPDVVLQPSDYRNAVDGLISQAWRRFSDNMVASRWEKLERAEVPV